MGFIFVKSVSGKLPLLPEHCFTERTNHFVHGSWQYGLSRARSMVLALWDCKEFLRAGQFYHTAWNWLHKLRRAMVRPGREQLTGGVEVDETYVGGMGKKSRGRGAKRKSIVAIAAEIRGRGPGRIRLSIIPDISAASLHQFITTHLVPGAEIHTDGWIGYNGLDGLGYDHVVTNISSSGDPAHVVMPRVHLVASLLDRWWLGIHQGAIRRSHLAYYLDEFTFRFNRRTSKARGLLFYRLMEQAVDCAPVSHAMITNE